MLEHSSEKSKNQPSKEASSKEEISRIVDWILQLKDLTKKENALAELSKKRESFPDLAVFLWFSPGTVASL